MDHMVDDFEEKWHETRASLTRPGSGTTASLQRMAFAVPSTTTPRSPQWHVQSANISIPANLMRSHVEKCFAYNHVPLNQVNANSQCRKMFIGGLNWETTEDSLKGYFTQFGEVSECTVMRDSATGRSRGFGFLTFRDPKCVNIVMVKEHYLDGKIIDPKRAIPREEQERTSKIFVGGVSQEATEEDFTAFFKQFGRVVDATLMMDKETGRPRGFGFVTFDGDAAVDATLKGPLQILGKPIEVKRAQPRGNMRDDDGGDNKKFGRNKFNNRDNGHNNHHNNNNNGGYDNQQNQGQAGASGMSPAMMAQYWQRMQQYFQTMQQSLAQQQQGPMANPMGGMPGGMNPMAMQQMQQQMMQGGGMNRNTGSPNPQMMGQGGMNPMAMQQMQQMQAMQAMQQGGGGGNNAGNGGAAGGGGNVGIPQHGPAFNAQDQLKFEQQKLEQQLARTQQRSSGYHATGGPTAWEGMYDDAPQPHIPSGPGRGGGGSSGGFNKGGSRSRQGSSQPPVTPGQAPINAPTGPKNAGKPGANYRGGGRGQNYRHQPYGGGRGA
ncbi:hypothetical protein LEMA_P030280.1 [Plenodomus lingam JN3]|uniref:RRM domain-containing protein n=1 Tax=Leptosphaeria maculans (strain JN3 / isolate v23.1.3 / race Av1-4-5-6-7-8) TaxID=985895 RepID=E4ZWA0_LEPMJ|nr:hypothetical protein LEMA_P030280.1 [Plenodomus lingam JN3]CBX95876.1 hypothetical protein LEMA_P030280.1 [Plenodomus lingam JN3]